MSDAKNPLLSWIIGHDDSKLFIFLYITLAVVLSVFISLFWLVVVVGIHFIFEWIKLSREEKSTLQILIKTLWVLKLDIVLILFAVFLSIYMDVIFGIAGLGAAGRTIAQSGSRVAAWQRGLRGALMSLDDVAQLSKFKTSRKNETAENAGGKESKKKIAFSTADAVLLFSLLFFTLSIIFAPYFTSHTYNNLYLLLLHEFTPFP